MMIRSALVAVLLLSAVWTPSPAGAADPGARDAAYRAAPQDGPACDAAGVLSKIAGRFDKTEAEYWHTGVRMAEIVSPREAGFRYRGTTYTARRHCVATAYLTDGSRHELVYRLRSEQGFAGYGWGVEFCLVGRDRSMSYAPDCGMLRPS